MEVIPLPVLYFRSKRDYATGAIVLRDGVVGEQDSRSSLPPVDLAQHGF
jgi:hypothetical protein